jgi:hypothetical protein
MRLTDYVTLNFNHKIFMAAVLLDIEKAFDTTWHPDLIYKLSTLELSTTLIKLINSFFSQGKFRVSVDKENKSRSVAGFRLIPHTPQLVYKWHLPPNNRC